MNKNQLIKMGQHIGENICSESLEECKNYNDLAQYAKDGGGLVYLDSVREFLADIYEETEEEAEKYSNDQVWNRYVHLWGIMANHKKYITAQA